MPPTFVVTCIFMDDNVSVIDSKEGVLAWRMFEEFLTSVHAASSCSPRYTWTRLRTKGNQNPQKQKCPVRKHMHYTGTLWYDAMINAFHFKAMQHLLPYNHTFDKKTWWTSQMALIVKSEKPFRGQVVLHREFRCRGTQNRPYSRDHKFTLLCTDSSPKVWMHTGIQGVLPNAPRS